MTVSGRTILNFGGSAYLGLGAEPRILEAGVEALRGYGAVNQLPRHYGFELQANADAEQAAREFFAVDGAMFVATGYLFGLIAMQGLAREVDAIVLDESAHYGLVDGARSTGLPIHRFAHCNPADLARVLEKELMPGTRPLVATDGMFPTFGNTPPLADYLLMVEARSGWLVVDESHAFGALGATGGGAVQHAMLPRTRVVAGGSTGKALGAQGGLAVGSLNAIEAMWEAPAARGAALGSSAAAAMTAASLRHIGSNPQLLLQLRANADRMKKGLADLGLALPSNSGPLATFVHGTAKDMQAMQASLWEQGIFVIYSTYVGAGPAGAIRCAAFADHTEADIDRLCTVLAASIKEVRA